MDASTGSADFDRGAAVTRSMLGWGVVAGPFYLVFARVLARTPPRVEHTPDGRSQRQRGGARWLQGLNLALSGLMCVVAGLGMLRTPEFPRTPATLVQVYGLCLVLSAAFPPDPTTSFPPGAGGGEMTLSGCSTSCSGRSGS